MKSRMSGFRSAGGFGANIDYARPNVQFPGSGKALGSAPYVRFPDMNTYRGKVAFASGHLGDPLTPKGEAVSHRGPGGPRREPRIDLDQMMKRHRHVSGPRSGAHPRDRGQGGRALEATDFVGSDHWSRVASTSLVAQSSGRRGHGRRVDPRDSEPRVRFPSEVEQVAGHPSRQSWPRWSRKCRKCTATTEGGQ